MKTLILLLGVLFTSSCASESNRGSLQQPRGYASRDLQIALDAKFSNYGAYIAGLLNQVRDDWIAIRSSPTDAAEVVVKVELASDGSIKLEGTHSSTADGRWLIDECAKVIVDHAPYRQWTRQMVEVLGKSQMIEFRFVYASGLKKGPNQALEPTTMLGTSAAEQPLVPSMVVAHL